MCTTGREETEAEESRIVECPASDPNSPNPHNGGPWGRACAEIVIIFQKEVLILSPVVTLVNYFCTAGLQNGKDKSVS